MFLTLAAGVALWVVYGVLNSDVVIIIANYVSFALLMGVLYFKLREHRAGEEMSVPGRFVEPRRV
jgi:MtN3 and saliva related transmembrane protein